MATTKYNISTASAIAGKSRTTIAAHIKEGKLSCEPDGKGSKLIDASELIRVYGDDCDFSLTNGSPKSSGKSRGGAVTSDDQSVHVQLTIAQQQLEAEKAERERERRQYQDQIDNLQDSLKVAQGTANKAMLLLENRNSGGGELEKAIKELEARIANQEEAAKQRLVKEEGKREAIDAIKRQWWLPAIIDLVFSDFRSVHTNRTLEKAPTNRPPG